MIFIILFLIFAGVALSIYAATLYHDLYLKGYHHKPGRKMSLKSLKLIITKEMPIEDKAIAIKCLKLYYCYLIVFYSSCILIVYFVVSGINK